MDIIYTGERLIKNKKSCFLAGPTPRDKNTLSWRGEAIEIFNRLGFDGAIYVPELKNKSYYDNETSDYEISLDQEMLEEADIVMFWMPRDINMLGLSSNVEFGYLLNKGNIIYGRPDDAIRCEFLDFLYEKKLGKKYLTTLEDTIKETIKHLESRYDDEKVWR